MMLYDDVNIIHCNHMHLLAMWIMRCVRLAALVAGSFVAR